MPTTYPLQPILDLYCGLGFFAIDLARRFPNIKAIGYEVYENMIKLAKRNAEQNGVADRTEFFSGKAEALDWQNVGADAVIVDPPRAGLHPKVIRTLLERKPETIIYVSCNYHRLAHELKEFKKKYQIKDLKALDLFPDTPHAEMAVKLQRK
jgi:tRNA (uracil-5-)-methyltransferase